MATTEREAVGQQIDAWPEARPSQTDEGRQLLERRRAVGWAAAWREYVERQEREQPRR